jgi:hypothetical protein
MKRFVALAGSVCAAVMLSACAHSTPAAATTSSVSVPASSASTTAAQAVDLTPFVGEWEKHAERLVIDNAGAGTWSYADVGRCPECSTAEAPTGTLTFTLTSVADNVARGAVTASSDADNGAVGDAVIAKIVPGFENKGVNLVMTIGKATMRVMCNSTSVGQCGA